MNYGLWHVFELAWITVCAIIQGKDAVPTIGCTRARTLDDSSVPWLQLNLARDFSFLRESACYARVRQRTCLLCLVAYRKLETQIEKVATL